MSYAYKWKVISRIKALGCDLHVNEGTRESSFWIGAPAGHIFHGTTLHCLVYPFWHDDTGVEMEKMYKSILEDLEDGLILCPNKDCDVCIDSREDQ